MCHTSSYARQIRPAPSWLDIIQYRVEENGINGQIDRQTQNAF